VTQVLTLEVMSMEGVQKVIMTTISIFIMRDSRKIKCMDVGVELLPARGNYLQSLQADSVTSTAKLRHGTVENTILSFSFDVFHDVSIHPRLSVHPSLICIFKHPLSTSCHRWRRFYLNHIFC
jgi:nucleosome binding factor SPN SPT16 subunit